MRSTGVLVLAFFVTGCGAGVTDGAPITVIAGAYSAVSINGRSLPVETTPTADGSKQEIVFERLWLGGTAGTNSAIRRIVFRVTTPTATLVDSITTTGTFYPTLAVAQTSFGPMNASGSQLILKATDGSTRVYIRAE